MHATGFLPLGTNWPFQVEHTTAVAYEAGFTDDEDDDTVQEKSVDRDRRHFSCNIVLINVAEDLSESTAAILELSDPNIFMLLGINLELLNDLVFLDHLREDNAAFTYMAQSLQQLALHRKKQTTAPHMELPHNIDNEEYWKDVLSNAGDHMHPTDVVAFFHYHKDRNSKYAVPYELYTAWLSAYRCTSSSFCYKPQWLSRALSSSLLERHSKERLLNSWLITCATVLEKHFTLFVTMGVIPTSNGSTMTSYLTKSKSQRSQKLTGTASAMDPWGKLQSI